MMIFFVGVLAGVVLISSAVGFTVRCLAQK
jgi:hypothetical protein